MGSFFDSSAGGIIGGAAGLIGSALSNRAMLKAQRETNALNYKIWGEQQQHNIDMFNLQNQANIDMWNMQNDYNDPSQQIARLSAAGLNPVLALGGNPTGNATSAPAAGQIQNPSAPQMQMPPAQAFDLRIGEAVDRAMRGFALGSQLENDETNRNNTRANTSRISALYPEELNLLKEQTAGHKSQRELTNEMLEQQRWNTNNIRLDYKFNKDTYQYRKEQQKQIMREMQARNVLSALDAETKRLFNQWYEPRMALDMTAVAHNIMLTDASIKEKHAMVANLIARTAGQKISNRIAEQTADKLILSLNMQHDADYVGHTARKYVNEMDLERDRNTYLHHNDLSTDFESFLDQGKRYFGRFVPFLK